MLTKHSRSLTLSQSCPKYYVKAVVEDGFVNLSLTPFNIEGEKDMHTTVIDDTDTLIAIKEILNEAFENI